MHAREFEQLGSDEHSAEASRHADANTAAQGLAEAVNRRASRAQIFQDALATVVQRVPGLCQFETTLRSRCGPPFPHAAKSGDRAMIRRL